MLDVADFRRVFPEFADSATFPDVQIQFWLNAATQTLPLSIWGGSWDHAVLLLAAHQIALSARRGRAMAGGNGGGMGAVSSKSVGGVSIAYNTDLGTMEGAGPYNLTPYGVEFWQMLKMLGIGAFQL